MGKKPHTIKYAALIYVSPRQNIDICAVFYTCLFGAKTGCMNMRKLHIRWKAGAICSKFKKLK